MSRITLRMERRLFQLVVWVGALVPILAGAAGALHGPKMIKGFAAASVDLDSHFRYLSGLLLAIGIAFAVCAVHFERRAFSFYMLGFIVVTGGLARLTGIAFVGPPSGGHRFGLLMELVVVPALMLWLRRIQQRSGEAGSR